MKAWLLDAPIRYKLVALGLMASACALIVASLVFLVATYLVARRVLHQNVVAQSTITADNVAAALAFGDRADAADTLRALRATPSIDVACLWDAQPQLFASYQRSSTLVCSNPPAGDLDWTGTGHIEIARGIAVGSRHVGMLQIRANLNEVATRLGIQTGAAAAALILGALVGLAIAMRFQRIVAGPLTELASKASDISRRGDYSVRAEPLGQDELGQLVLAFNDMLGQIQRREEELRAAGRVKDEFLAVLSHELRTPMNAILGWSRLLRDRERRNDAALDRGLDAITRNAQLQTQLIADLLDVSAIITGKFSMRFSRVDLRAVIAAAIDSVRPAADNKNVRINTDVDAAGRAFVSGDAARLQQVVWNLLSNAIKFTPKEGRIDVRLRQVESDLEITVSDSGVGIDAEFLPYVFERFRQADSSPTRAYRGLGLGLAIARHLTDAHGGSVSAHSEGVGKGSTFRVRLPVSAVAADLAPERRHRTCADVSLSNLHILVVDDEPDARDVVTLTLQAAGADVMAVASADEAVESLTGNNFHALVADIGMPVHDGFWLIRAVRALPTDRGGGTPAIALTAYATPQDRREALAAGFDRHIPKPVEPDELCAVVAAVAGREPQRL